MISSCGHFFSSFKSVCYFHPLFSGQGHDDPDISHTTFGGLDAHTACEIDFLAALRGEREVVYTAEDALIPEELPQG